MSTVVERLDQPGEPKQEKEPFVYRSYLPLFIALVSCFTAWGIAADMTAPLVAAFKRIFEMSTFQASLVQFAYYGAYFLLALPAAFINQRFGYKAGILTGLGLASVGAFAFYPASKIMTYIVFLVALFLLAAGLSILETSANPFVISMGPESNATRRLNFAQAFNPVGTNIGVLLAATLILPRLHAPVDRASVSAEQLRTIQGAELQAVMVPYIGLALLLILIWVAIAIQKAPQIREEFPTDAPETPQSGSFWAGCTRTRATASASSRSSSTSPPRWAPGRSPSSMSSRPWEAASRRAVTSCSSA